MREQGSSLVELLAVLVLLGVVSAAVGAVVVSQLRGERAATEVREAQAEARKALDRMRADIRSGYTIKEDSNAAYVRVWVNEPPYRGPGHYLPDVENVSYRILGTELQRRKGDSSPWVVVARNLLPHPESGFTYYPSLSPGGKCWSRCVVTVTIAVQPGSRAPLRLSDAIRLRNAP